MEIKNVGHHVATDIIWNVDITGGIIIPRNHSGVIESIDSWKSEKITISVIGIGLGLFLPAPIVRVTAKCTEGSSTEETVEAKVLLFFIFVPD